MRFFTMVQVGSNAVTDALASLFELYAGLGFKPSAKFPLSNMFAITKSPTSVRTGVLTFTSRFLAANLVELLELQKITLEVDRAAALEYKRFDCAFGRLLGQVLREKGLSRTALGETMTGGYVHQVIRNAKNGVAEHASLLGFGCTNRESTPRARIAGTPASSSS